MFGPWRFFRKGATTLSGKYDTRGRKLRHFNLDVESFAHVCTVFKQLLSHLYMKEHLQFWTISAITSPTARHIFRYNLDHAQQGMLISRARHNRVTRKDIEGWFSTP